MNKIGIIGASGFIGSNLVHFLKKHPEFSVLPVSREVQDPAFLKDFVQKVDTVIYLAHEGGPNQPIPQKIAIEKNITPLKNLIAEFKSAKKSTLTKLIYLSSGGTVYGISKKSIPWLETDPLNPVSSYGQTKIRAEKLIQVATEYGLCEGICIRAANPYGNFFDHAKPQGVIDVIISRLINEQPFTLYDSIETVRDYLHLDDLNRAMVAALLYKTKFDIFNIGSSKGTALKDIIQKIENISGKKLDMITLPPNENITLIPWSVLNIQKAKDVMDWEPNISLDEGLKKLIHRKLAL